MLATSVCLSYVNRAKLLLTTYLIALSSETLSIPYSKHSPGSSGIVVDPSASSSSIGERRNEEGSISANPFKPSYI